MKKKLMALLTAIVMVFALTACGGGADLEDVLTSSEWQSQLKLWNDQVTSLGISIDTVADGNTLVFEWHLPDNDAFNTLSEDDCSEMISPFLQVLDSGNFITEFKDGYKVSLDAVRCTLIKGDGTEIYRDEITK